MASLQIPSSSGRHKPRRRIFATFTACRGDHDIGWGAFANSTRVAAVERYGLDLGSLRVLEKLPGEAAITLTADICCRKSLPMMHLGTLVFLLLLRLLLATNLIQERHLLL